MKYDEVQGIPVRRVLYLRLKQEKGQQALPPSSRLITARETEHLWRGTLWRDDNQLVLETCFSKTYYQETDPPRHPERVVQ